MPVTSPEMARLGVSADVLSALITPIARAARNFLHERRMARAERCMERLNDDLLKDIGLHRSQIHFATRMGRGDAAHQTL